MERKPGAVVIKSQDEDTAIVAGYGVVFGGVDLEGDTFTDSTDLMLDMVPAKSLFYEHTHDIPQHALGQVKSEEKDEVGLWIEAQLDKSKAYASAVLDLIEEGVIGLSSGSVGHLIRREGKNITQWPVVEFSLTPQPAEPRTLGVSQLKALFSDAGLSVPDAFNEAREGESGTEDSDVAEIHTGDKNIMTEELEVLNEDAITDKVLATLRKEQEAEAERQANIKAIEEAAVEKARAEWESNAPRWRATFNTKELTESGSDDGGTKAYFHYLRTGDLVPYDQVYSEAAVEQLKYWSNDGAVKAALQGQTDAEGGYLVPDDFYNQIVAKRDDMSVIRRAGATVIQTSLDRVLIPNEGTSMAKFAITAEEAAVDEDEPTFGQAVATVYKATKLEKVSWELMGDEKANLQGFLGNAFGRAEAEFENYYFVSTGTGTGQPKAALIESGVAVTAAGTNSITAAEMNTLIYGLGGGYASSPSAALVAERATIGAIFALTGNNFMFQETPAGAAQGAGDQFARTIEGIPFFADETMPSLATATKPVLIGDFSYYFVAERSGMVIQRLDELYAGNGQIGLLAHFRRGGVAGQAEAFKHLLLS
jgi:HK97 family phage major capsid protein